MSMFGDLDEGEIEARMIAQMEKERIGRGEQSAPSARLEVVPAALDADGNPTGQVLAQVPPPPGTTPTAPPPPPSTPDSSEPGGTLPPPGSPPAPSTESDEGGGWVEPDTNTQPTTDTPDSLPPPAPDAPVTPGAYRYTGLLFGNPVDVELRPEQMSEALEVFGLYQSWSPETKQQINALLTGAYELVPRGATSPSAPGSSGSAPSTAPTTDPAAPTIDWEEVGNDALRTAWEAQQRELAELRQATQTLTAATVEQQNAQILAAAQAKQQALMTELSLTSEEINQVENYLVQLNMVPALTQTYGGDRVRAYEEGLRYAYSRHPLSQRKVEQVIDTEAETRARLATRKQNAGKLGGNSGTPTPTPTRAANKEDRMAAMVEGIRAAQQ